MASHDTSSTRITGNEDAAGIDPGGTRSTRPGQADKSKPAAPPDSVTLPHHNESGDRNDHPDVQQRPPHKPGGA